MESNKITKEEEEEKKKPEGDAAAAAAKSMERDRRNDCDDAESSSGSEPPSSSSQGTSGGAGYSGDYSSISDSSETGGSQSKPEGGKKISVSEPILKNKSGKYARRQQKRTNKSTAGVDANLPDADRSSEHIHHYHHHRQAPDLYSQDANSDEDINLDINRKISEIMSLYKVSLHAQRDVKNAARAHLKMNAEAAAKQAAESTSLNLPLQVENSQPHNVLANPQGRTSQQMSVDQDEAHDELMDSSECYAHLVEACRPFFNDSRSLMTTEKPLPPIQVNAGTDEAHSSSGFTSFFTTTNQSGSNSNNGGSGGSSNDSSNQKKASPQAAETNSHTQQMEQDNAADNDASSETSSLVVQARVKRKYKEKSRRTSSSNSDQTNTNQNINVGSEKNDETLPSKRVRIETVALDVANAKSKEKTKSKQHQQRTESSSLTSSLSASTETNSAPKAKAEKGETNQSQGTSTSAKPRVVTESSSGTTTANNSSGSGNDNNTTSKSESGGDGNSDEQKLPGDRDSTSETGAGDSQEEQQKSSSHTQPIAKTDKPLIHHHHRTRNEKKYQEDDVLDPSASAERQDEEDALVSKEKRLEKKRKRRESRREYEEELRQMRDSSENNSDAALEPGTPVTLEEVLSLTKTARLLVQALPPFLAVHINAGFTNLCGIQSSAIIGRPVSTFLSLPSSKEGESSGSDNANSREESDKMSSLSGSGSADDAQNASSSVLANGGGQVGDAAALAGGNFQNRPLPLSGLRIDRLIVARGYGHIHVVELECHSRFQDQHAHAIEGSEVKFIEGNKPSKRKKTNPKLLCRMSVSPVVSASAQNQSETSQKGADSNSGTKRRKHRHPTELQSVKHYLIQLEAANGPRSLVSGSTSGATDTTLEAQLLGITKAEVQARRCRLETRPEQHVENEVQPQQEVQQQDHEDSVDDNSSSTMELVATCG